MLVLWKVAEKMKSESDFSRWIKPKLELKFKVYDFEDSAPPATPDLHLLDRDIGRGSWAELKFVRKGENKLKFQKGQAKWLVDYEANNGRAFVIWSDGAEIFFARGKFARKLEFITLYKILESRDCWRFKLADWKSAILMISQLSKC